MVIIKSYEDWKSEICAILGLGVLFSMLLIGMMNLIEINMHENNLMTNGELILCLILNNIVLIALFLGYVYICYLLYHDKYIVLRAYQNYLKDKRSEIIASEKKEKERQKMLKEYKNEIK